MSLVARGGHARKKQRPETGRRKASTCWRALRVSIICYFIFEPPCGSPRLAFATHSQSMSDCLDRPAQWPSLRPPLVPRRPREAWHHPRLAHPAPLVPRSPGAAQPAAAPAAASQQALTLPNSIDRGGLAKVCLLPLNPSQLSSQSESATGDSAEQASSCSSALIQPGRTAPAVPLQRLLMLVHVGGHIPRPRRRR